MLDENLPQLFMGYLTTHDPSLQALLQQAMLTVSSTLDSSRQQLDSAYAQLEEGRQQLEQQKADGQKQLEDAKAELDRSERCLLYTSFHRQPEAAALEARQFRRRPVLRLR